MSLKIFDLSGREVYSANEHKNEGTYQLIFDGSEFASGVYFFKLQSGSYSSVRKMLLVK